MFQLIKKSLPAIAIYSSFVILNNLYLFSQYKTMNSPDDSLILFARISSPLAIIGLISLALNMLIGWLNFKKVDSFKRSLTLNGITALGVFVVLFLFDMLMSIVTPNYFQIMAAFVQADSVLAAIQIISSRLFATIIAFAFFTLASFIFSKILKKK